MVWKQITFRSDGSGSNSVVAVLRRLWSMSADADAEGALVYYRSIDDGCEIVFSPSASELFSDMLRMFVCREVSAPTDVEQLVLVYSDPLDRADHG